MGPRITIDVHRVRARAWQQFVDAEGRQPGNRPDVPRSETALYYWVYALRSAASAGTLDPAVEEMLDREAPLWQHAHDPLRERPELRIKHAEEYRAFLEEHGRRPRRIDADDAERRLHTWMTNQRAALSNGRLSAELRDAIAEVLPGWDAPRARGGRSISGARLFTRRLAELTEYVETHGGALPPVRVGDDAHSILGRWLARQRHFRRLRKLSLVHEFAIEDVAPTWAEMPERRAPEMPERRAPEMPERRAPEMHLPEG